MADLFDKIGWINKIMAFVAYLVVVVAAASILASIYNSMNERRRQIAILRALGARRQTVFLTIFFEAVSIAALGVLIGFLFYFALVWIAGRIIHAETGVLIDPFTWNRAMLWAPAGLLALGALAGIVPGLKAYKTDVAENLAPIS